MAQSDLRLEVLGVAGDSAEVRIEVGDDAPTGRVPLIGFASPQLGEVLGADGTVRYELNAWDPDVGELDGAGIDQLTLLLQVKRLSNDDHYDASPPVVVATTELTEPPFVWELDVDELGLQHDTYMLVAIAKNTEGVVNYADFRHVIRPGSTDR